MQRRTHYRQGEFIIAFTLRQLRYFVAVAEQETVTGAARMLSISQSAITESLKDLEADLGVLLFERHSRGLSITHQGQQFLRHANRILGDVSDARQAITVVSHDAADTLQLGVTPLVAGYVLSDLLSRFRRAQVSVQVQMIEDNADHLEHLLLGGELDVGLMLTSSLKDRDALCTSVLDESPFRVWLPAGHSLASSNSIAVEQLAGEPVVSLRVDEVERTTNAMLESMSPSSGVSFRTQSVEAVRSLVATGAGIAFMPDLVYRPWSLEGDRIEACSLTNGLANVQVGIVWRRGSTLPRAARDFIAVAELHRQVRR